MIRAVYNSASSAIRIIADAFSGAGTTGLVPDPGAEAGKYLKDDGTWATPAGGGGGNDIYVEEGDVAVGDSSGADLTLDFDGDDFNLSIAAQEIELTVNDGGIDHNALANTHNLTDDIDHDALTNFDAAEHFTEGSIDHTAIQNIGTTSHANIDTHVGDTTFHLTSGQKTDLTDSGDSALHYHATDRARANHSGTQAAATISDFDTEVGNHTDVAANTSARHTRSHAVTSALDHTAGAHKIFYTDASGNLVELTHGFAGELLTSGGPGVAPSWFPAAAAVVNLKPAVFSDSTGNQTVTTASPILVNIDNTILADANYTLATDTILLRTSGIYEIDYVVCFTEKDLLGAARGSVECWLEDDLSGSYVATPGSYSRDYIREASYHGSCAGGTIKDFTSANKHVRLYAQRIYISNPNIKTVANKVMIKIKRLGNT